MRKNFMLSLAAMAALPMAGLADATVSLEGTTWKQGDKEVEFKDGSYTSEQGVAISLTMNLVPGKYVFSSVEDTGAKVVAVVNGAEYADGQEFTIYGESAVEVTFKVEATTPNASFTTKGVKVTLKTDLTDVQTQLTTQLNNAWSKITASDANDAWLKELLAEYAKYEALINSISVAGEDSYEVYVEQELYKANLQDSKIYKDLEAYRQSVDGCNANYAAYKYALKGIEGVNDEIDNVTSALAGTDKYGKAIIDATKAFFNTHIDALNAEMDAFKESLATAYQGRTAATEYTQDVVDPKVNEWLKSAQKLNENDKIKYYNVVKINFVRCYESEDAGKLGYQPLRKALSLALANDANKNYTHLIECALTELADAYAPAAQIDNTINDLDYVWTTTKMNDMVKILKTIYTKNFNSPMPDYVNMTEVYEKYMGDGSTIPGRVNDYKAAYDYVAETFETPIANIKAALDEFKEGNEYAVLYNKINAANNIISNTDSENLGIKNKLAKGIEDNAAVPAYKELSYTITYKNESGKDVKEEDTTLEKFISGLSSATQNLSGSYANWKVLNNLIGTNKAKDGLQDLLAFAENEVAKYASDSYVGKDYWTGNYKAIKDKIAAFETAVKAAKETIKNANRVLDFADEKQIYNDAVALIDAYPKDVKDAFDNYEAATTAIADLKAQQAAVKDIPTDGDVIYGGDANGGKEKDYIGKTYSYVLTDIARKVNNADQDMTAALAAKDAAHATKLAALVKALGDNPDFTEDVIKPEWYEKDREYYTDNILPVQSAQALVALVKLTFDNTKKTVAAKRAEYSTYAPVYDEETSEEITPSPLGNSFETLKDTFNGLETQVGTPAQGETPAKVGTLESEIQTCIDVTYATITKENADDVTDAMEVYRERLATINSEISEKLDFAKIIADVQANEAMYAELNPRYTALETAIESINKMKLLEPGNPDADPVVPPVYSDTEFDEASLNKDLNRKGEFDELTGLRKNLEDKRTGTKDGTNDTYTFVEAYENEALVKDNFKKWITDLEAEVQEAKAKAIASTDNFNAYEEQKAAVKKNLYKEVDFVDAYAFIEQQIKDIEAIATPVNAGQQYFLDKIGEVKGEIIAFVGDLETYGTIRKSYVDHTSATNSEELNKAINKYQVVGGYVATAQLNETTYNTLKTKYDEVTKLSKEVSELLKNETEIGETSKIKEWKSEVTKTNAEIEKTQAKIEENFKIGNLANDQLYASYYKTLDAIKNQLNGDGYLTTLKTENETRYNDFKKAHQDAVDAYTKYTGYLDMFETLKNNPDVDFWGNFENTIKHYRAQLDGDKEKLDELKENTDKAYQNVLDATDKGTHSVFDLQESNKTNAKNLQTSIENDYSDASEQLNSYSKDWLNEKLTTVLGSLNAANNSIKNYHKELQTPGFSEEQDLYDLAQKKYKNDKELAITLANGLFDKVSGLNDAVINKWEQLAKEEFGLIASEIADDYKEAVKFLKETPAPEGDDFDYLKAYQDAYDKYILGTDGFLAVGAQYVNSGEMHSTGLDQVKNKKTQFEANNKYEEFCNKVKNAPLSNACYLKLQEDIQAVQTTIEKAKAYAEPYYSTNAWIATADRLLTTIKEAVESYNKAYTVHIHEDYVREQLDVCKEYADDLKKGSDDAEITAMGTLISDLQDRYDNAVITEEQEAEYKALNPKGLSDELKKIKENFYSSDPQPVKDDLLALQTNIAKAQTAIEDFLDAKTIAKAYKEVTDLVAEIQATCEDAQTALASCHEYVKNQYSESVQALLDEAKAIADDAAKRHEDKTFNLYKENLKKAAEALSKDASLAANSISVDELLWKNHDAAVQSLQEKIDGYKTKLAAIDQKVQGFEFINYEDYSKDDGRKNFLNALEKDQQWIDGCKAVNTPENLIDYTARLVSGFSYEIQLLFIDKLYSQIETVNRINNLYTLLNNARYSEMNGYKTVLTNLEMNTMYSELEQKFNGNSALVKYYYAAVNDGYATADVYGNAFIDEQTGEELPGKLVDFVEEGVPAMFARVDEIRKDIEAFRQTIIENRYKPGNVTGNDDEVLVDDYTTILYHVLAKSQFEVGSKEWCAADVNGDGEVNIGDLTAVAQMINGTYAGSSSRAQRVAAQTSDFLSVVCEGEGVHQRIGLLLNANQAYAGAQLDITLPEGVTLSNESTGFAADGFSLNSNDLDNGAHRIVLSSLSGSTFSTDGEAILWLDVDVDHNYNGQEIEISNIYFSDANGGVFSLTAKQGDTTGLSNVSMTEEVKDKIYNVGGILMDGLKRGVNIIRGNDGSSKKVIIK